MKQAHDMLKPIIITDPQPSEASSILLELFNQRNCPYFNTSNIDRAVTILHQENIQVIIVDLNQSEDGALSCCKQLRKIGIDIPIIVISSFTSLEHIISTFQAGSDDYLKKPFSTEEFWVRVLALSKRRSGNNTRLVVGDLELDINKQEAYRRQVKLNISPIKLKILETLMRSSPNPVSRRKLIQSVWGEHHPASSCLRVHIYSLRKTLNAVDPYNLIHTVPSFGFVIEHKEIESKVNTMTA